MYVYIPNKDIELNTKCVCKMNVFFVGTPTSTDFDHGDVWFNHKIKDIGGEPGGQAGLDVGNREPTTFSRSLSHKENEYKEYILA